MKLTQNGRELGVRPDQLRKWKQQDEQRAGAPPADVFPGRGKLPSEQEELLGLQRENARLQQEVAFLSVGGGVLREDVAVNDKHAAIWAAAA